MENPIYSEASLSYVAGKEAYPDNRYRMVQGTNAGMFNQAEAVYDLYCDVHEKKRSTVRERRIAKANRDDLVESDDKQNPCRYCTTPNDCGNPALCLREPEQ